MYDLGGAIRLHSFNCISEMQAPLTQNMEMDPRIDYVYRNHPGLKYIMVEGESITEGQFIDRYAKSLSYIRRHGLEDVFADLGLPSADECARFREQYRGENQRYSFTTQQYFARYTAWHRIAWGVTPQGVPPEINAREARPSN